MLRPILRLSLVVLAALTYGAVRVDVVHAQSDNFVVAVLPFTSTDDGKSKDLQKHIIASLGELGLYTLVEQRAVNDAVGDAGFRPGAAIPDAKSLEIARELGAKIVAYGTLENRGGTWVAKTNFVEVGTRVTQELPEVSGRNPEEVGQKVVSTFNDRNQANKHIIFGIDYLRGENWERAIANFQQALQFDQTLAQAHFHLGQAHLKKGDPTTALQELQEAIRIDPAYISAYHTIGLAYIESGDTTAARNFFDQLVQRQGEDCDVQIAYGYVMANELGDLEKGLAAFERAKQLCPENPQAYQYLALTLPEDRGPEKIENFRRYLDLSEGKATDPEALQYLFGLYFAEEQFAEAKQTIDQVLAADPENAQLQLYAGMVAGKLSRHDEAITHFTKALEINPELRDAYVARAMSHEALGHRNEADEDFVKAGLGREVLANRALGDASRLLRSGRASAALEALGRAADLGASNCAIAYYRGQAYYQIGSAQQGEDKSLASNQRSIDTFRTAIRHLQNACGDDYAGPARGLINNSNQYIERGQIIVDNMSRGGR